MLTSTFYLADVLPTTSSIDDEPMGICSYDVVRKMLCKPVSYDKVQNNICTHYFETEQVTISMRLFCLHSDLPVVYNWLPWEYTRQVKKEAHVEQLYEMYDEIAHSGTSQSFMLMTQDMCLAQADVYNTLTDDIGLQYSVKKGDYRLQLLVKPEKVLTGSYAACALQATLDFLFSFEEMGRVVMALEANDYLNNKIEKQGFVFEKEFMRRQKVVRLYTCTKDDFRKATL